MSRSLLVVRSLAGLSVAGLLLFAPGCGSDRVEGTEAGDCSDGTDNDKDGTVDCDDSGCASASECKPEPTPEPTPEATPEATPEEEAPEATPAAAPATGDSGAAKPAADGEKPTATKLKPTATKAVEKPTATKAVDKPTAGKLGGGEAKPTGGKLGGEEKKPTGGKLGQ